jgi:hypothetical protein
MRAPLPWTRRPAALLLAAALAPWGAPASRAEVRLRSEGPDGAEVQVQASPRGVWSPTGGVDAHVLNPTGDLLGDGMPGTWTRGAEARVAWFRPLTSEIVVAEWTGDAWRDVARLEAAAALGAPRVGELDGAVLVVWMERAADGTTAVQAGVVASDGRVQHAAEWPHAVLLGMTSVEGVAVVGVAERLPGGSFDVVLSSPIRNPAEPIFWRAPTFLETIDASALVPGVTLLSGDSGSHALVAWWPDQRTLHFVLLDAGVGVGPVHELRSRGEAAYSPALVNEARRALRAASESGD